MTLLFGLLFTAFGPPAIATGNTTSYAAVVEGSALATRSQDDGWRGQVYIYVGGSLPAGTNLLEFRFLFDRTSAGNTAGYITPLLFEYNPVEAFTVYRVAGIGKGFALKLSSAPQAIPFDVIEGISVPTGGNFTFGFINAIVDTSGNPLANSAGTADYDNPGDGGQGVGGQETSNDWLDAGINSTQGPTVALGTTFGVPGAKSTYFLSLPYRTYSVQAVGAVAAP